MRISCGAKINYVSTIIRREIDKLESIQCMEKISGTNGFILVYISDREGPVYQKDIERDFGITRSTASKVISLMESKGMIIRRGVDNDARLKQLLLTEDAKSIVSLVKNDLDSFEKRLTNGLSQEEKKEFLALLSKIENNCVEGGNL